MEPTGGSPSGESGKDRSLENVTLVFKTKKKTRAAREQLTTDQKRTDLSELPDTSSPRDGTTRSVLTKSECATVDEITALVLEETSQKIGLVQQQALTGLTSLSQILMVFAWRRQGTNTFVSEITNPTLSHEPVIRRFLSPEPGVVSQNTRDVTGPEWPL